MSEKNVRRTQKSVTQDLTIRTLDNTKVKFTGVTTSGSYSAVSGYTLKVNIDGTDYNIQLAQ